MVEDQLKLRRLHDRQVGGLSASEDTADIRSRLTPCVRNVGSVTHQPADVCKLTLRISGRYSMADRLVDNVNAPASEISRRADEEGIPFAHVTFKGRVDVAAGAR